MIQKPLVGSTYNGLSYFFHFNFKPSFGSLSFVKNHGIKLDVYDAQMQSTKHF